MPASFVGSSLVATCASLRIRCYACAMSNSVKHLASPAFGERHTSYRTVIESTTGRDLNLMILLQIHFISASCENMIDGKGMLPGDVLTASNGKTVEVSSVKTAAVLQTCHACTETAARCNSSGPDRILESVQILLTLSVYILTALLSAMLRQLCCHKQNTCLNLLATSFSARMVDHDIVTCCRTW